jgi:hypothetical protein
MTIFLKESCNIYTIGKADMLYLFFSTIANELENRFWGSRFPKIMNHLYNGELKNIDIKQALEEINLVKEEFKKVNIQKMLSNSENLLKQEIRLPNLLTAKNGYEYFITSNGNNLVEVFIEVMQKAKLHVSDVKIVSRRIKETWLNVKGDV